MFQMTIEIYTMGSNCNLQTFVHIESDFFGSDMFSTDEDGGSYLLWSEFNFTHFYSWYSNP